MLGKFYWSDPNYRLDFSDPEPMTVLFNSHSLKVIRPEKNETVTRDLEHPAGIGHSPASPWFPSIGGLLDAYAFRLKGQGPIKDHDVWVLEGAAQDTARHPSRVMLWLDKATSEPLRMETYDGGEFPTSIFLVDSTAVFDSLRVPVRFRNWVGLESGTIEVTTALSGVRLNPVLHDTLFGYELQPLRVPDDE